MFIGNLRSGVTKAEIYEDLVRMNPAWAQACTFFLCFTVSSFSFEKLSSTTSFSVKLIAEEYYEQAQATLL